MNKPTTPLWDKNYIKDWQNWLIYWIQEQKYASLESALKGTMQETKGRINPKFIIDAWREINES